MTDAVGETSKDATAVNGLDTSAESSAGGVAAAPASSGGDAACGACGAALRSGDAFCENCGAAASGGPTGSPPDSPVGSPADPSAAAPPTPESVSNPASMSLPAPGAPNCRACGGAVLDDGFCGTCGERGRLPRDHWLEAPAPQLAGVCDKGIRHARNEDGMALGIAGTGASVAVVCDGVTTAPQSDRASLAAARAAAALLLDAAPAAQGSFAARIERWTTLLGEACRSANEVAIGVARTLGDPPEPPSCTFAAGVVDPDGLVAFAWCGDSRVYWLPDDGNAVVSVDHSLGAAMIAEGCIMLRACHRDTCKPGVATQRPHLRANFTGTPEGVAAYFLYMAEEVRGYLAELGLRVVPSLVNKLRSERREVRQAAVILLGMSREPGAMQRLSEHLVWEPTTVWLDVARALGWYGTAAIRSLCQLLRQETARIRFVPTLKHAS